ncbi:LLM class flavin-dependent oxidoreductase [Pseudoclavibacter endophyticus]|uniref:LLM class flavin-dependent oxidoreductase n=1 Tax=Pseudoclavibacter endophyticus TaxID=1778590 RepID=UPI0016670FB4|nr:LLM class flavin-dependent oxidoreductase [Pseudoclavibacter endophyticus]
MPLSSLRLEGDHLDLDFGVFDWLDAQPGVTLRDTYDARLRLVREAERLGFARYHLAEHHATPLGLAPSPAVFLAAAARETSTIRLAATTFITPLYDPLRLVEEIAMLDQLSGGRLEIGVGRGSSPIEAGMFGLDAEAAKARFLRDWPAMLDALRSGRFVRPREGTGVADGGSTAASPPVDLFVRPLQTPHPPLWYPTSNAESIPRLVTEGYHVLFGFGFSSPPLEVMREHATVFLRESAEVDASVAAAGPRRFGMVRHVYVGRDDAEAVETAREALAVHYDSFTHLWRAAGSERFTGPLDDLEDLVDRHLLFVGSAPTVAEQVTHAVRESGVNYVAGAFAWGSLSEQQSARSMQRFAREVMPIVHAGLEHPKVD